MSFIGWLDYSEEEQRRLRERLSLLNEKGTVDDLGIGTIRDAFSNYLFPGTSVIQTRARYFLFIPWIFRHAETTKPKEILNRAELLERKLIPALTNGGDLNGLIGRQVGKALKTLPSAIYWNGLATYGIFTSGGLSRAHYAVLAADKSRPADQADEFDERSQSFWNTEIPDPPEDFFEFTKVDFSMTTEEKAWLVERVLTTESRQGPNLLCDFVRTAHRGDVVSVDAFWRQIPASTNPQVRHVAQTAERFSRAMHGAALLYNLELARLRSGQSNDDAELANRLANDLAAWAQTCVQEDVTNWAADPTELESVLDRIGVHRSRARAFVRQWLSIVSNVDPDQVARDSGASQVIRQREIEHKKSLSRFKNRSRLATWNGASGLRPLDFRWSQVRDFLEDLNANSSISGGVNAPH